MPSSIVCVFTQKHTEAATTCVRVCFVLNEPAIFERQTNNHTNTATNTNDDDDNSNHGDLVTLKMLICRVRPGVLDTLATASPKRVLSMLLLPTFDRPRNAISGRLVYRTERDRERKKERRRRGRKKGGEGRKI